MSLEMCCYTRRGKCAFKTFSRTIDDEDQLKFTDTSAKKSYVVPTKWLFNLGDGANTVNIQIYAFKNLNKLEMIIGWLAGCLAW